MADAAQGSRTCLRKVGSTLSNRMGVDMTVEVSGTMAGAAITLQNRQGAVGGVAAEHGTGRGMAGGAVVMDLVGCIASTRINRHQTGGAAGSGRMASRCTGGQRIHASVMANPGLGGMHHRPGWGMAIHTAGVIKFSNRRAFKGAGDGQIMTEPATGGMDLTRGGPRGGGRVAGIRCNQIGGGMAVCRA